MYNTVNKNYRASFPFRNNTSHQKYSKGVVQISVNEPAFSIMFIPQYNTDNYPFPPFKYNLEHEGEKYYKSEKGGIEEFLEGDIMFFEHPDKKDKFFKIEYKTSLEKQKAHKLVYCLDAETYDFLIKDLRKISCIHRILQNQL